MYCVVCKDLLLFVFVCSPAWAQWKTINSLRVIYQLEVSRSALMVLSISPHSSAAWNVFGNGRGWLDECWYEKWRALVCNFGILSWLKSSCVYLLNIHLEPGTMNSTPQKPFKNKKPVRKTKCEQLTEHSAFRLIWKYLCCPSACLLYPYTLLYCCLEQIYQSIMWPTYSELHYQLLLNPQR